jgi:hypothetical protein
MLNAPLAAILLLPPSAHSLDGVAREHVKNGERGVATFVLKMPPKNLDKPRATEQRLAC